MDIERKYHQRVQHTQSLLCVGLDADRAKIPAPFMHEATPQFAFNRWIIEQTHPYVSAYKPNTAFYEAHGAQGWRELRLTMDYLHEFHPEIVTICDAKRADVGNTNQGYVQAIFDELGFDAITLHPYLGQEALSPFLERTDKASIILVRTSNPGAQELQHLPVGGQPLWEVILSKVAHEWNRHGNCMAVIGATALDDLARARALAPDLTFLVPGVGAQGGDAEAVLRVGKASNGLGLIVNASREVIFSADPASTARRMHGQLMPNS